MKKGDKVIMKSEGKEVKAKGKNRFDVKDLGVVLGQFFLGFALLGIAIYVVAEYKLRIFQPFQLATVAAFLGGFPLVAVFGFGEKIDDKRMRDRLRMVGGLYLLAAICFVVFGFYQAADMAGLLPASGAASWILKVVYGAAFTIGALGMAFGMLESLRILPWLLRPFWDSIRDGAMKIFEEISKRVR